MKDIKEMEKKSALKWQAQAGHSIPHRITVLDMGFSLAETGLF